MENQYLLKIKYFVKYISFTYNLPFPKEKFSIIVLVKTFPIILLLNYFH